MASVDTSIVRPLLIERRDRLTHAASSLPDQTEIDRLLTEVDAALARLDAGAFGLCEVCHDPVEAERLLADPLVRFCLDHLDAAGQKALQDDLESAGRVQRRLLPPSHLVHGRWETAYHWRPAGPVSGDFCDLSPIPERDDDLFILLGDVAGKGVAAGLLTAHLHAAFRSLLPVETATADLVERVNRLFRGSALAPHFATVVAATLGADGSVDLCNAAHCPPLLATDDGVRSLDPTGMPVGAFYSAGFGAHRFAMKPGDVMLLYTDGASEARDRSGCEYGPERLRDLLAAGRRHDVRELVRECLADLERHLDGSPITDDLTVLAVRRAG
jgi:phosphoserine phosphatase RsbU/P